MEGLRQRGGQHQGASGEPGLWGQDQGVHGKVEQGYWGFRSNFFLLAHLNDFLKNGKYFKSIPVLKSFKYD